MGGGGRRGLLGETTLPTNPSAAVLLYLAVQLRHLHGVVDLWGVSELRVERDGGLPPPGLLVLILKQAGVEGQRCPPDCVSEAPLVYLALMLLDGSGVLRLAGFGELRVEAAAHLLLSFLLVLVLKGGRERTRRIPIYSTLPPPF